MTWIVERIILLLLLGYGWQPYGTTRMTWYGYGDGFAGRRTAASWHGKVPEGVPGRVTQSFPGVAAPSSIPFGTIVRCTRKGTGQTALAVVLDRTGSSQGWDAHPELAKRLGFGPTYGREDVGRIIVEVEILVEGAKEEAHESGRNLQVNPGRR